MNWTVIINKYNIIKHIRFINELKDIKKIYCDDLNSLDNIKKMYIMSNFYMKWCSFEPYYGPSSNKLKDDCHPGFGCLLCKQSGLKL